MPAGRRSDKPVLSALRTPMLRSEGEAEGNLVRSTVPAPPQILRNAQNDRSGTDKNTEHPRIGVVTHDNAGDIGGVPIPVEVR